MKRLFPILLVLVPCILMSGSARYVDAPELKKEDRAAINLNFEKIDTEFGTTVHKTGTETITGSKTFSSVTISTLTATTVTASTLTVTNTITGGWLAAPYPMMIVRDEKAASTDGGTFTSGSWQTRTLNTTSTNTIAGASLSANKITLPSGTYYVYFCAPALLVDRHQSRFVSTSGASVSIIGQTANASSASNGMSTSLGSGVFSVPSSSTTVVELQHQCQTTKATNGLGSSAGFTTEVYAFVEITKVK